MLPSARNSRSRSWSLTMNPPSRAAAKPAGSSKRPSASARDGGDDAEPIDRANPLVTGLHEQEPTVWPWQDPPALEVQGQLARPAPDRHRPSIHPQRRRRRCSAVRREPSAERPATSRRSPTRCRRARPPVRWRRSRRRARDARRATAATSVRSPTTAGSRRARCRPATWRHRADSRSRGPARRRHRSCTRPARMARPRPREAPRSARGREPTTVHP